MAANAGRHPTKEPTLNLISTAVRRLCVLLVAAVVAVVTTVVSLGTPAQADLQECPRFAGGPACLVLNLQTGGDDLRGGNDNVNVTVSAQWRAPRTRFNVNQSTNWANNSLHQVQINLDSLFGTRVAMSEITTVTLTTTFSGGIGGDNWNLNGFNVSYDSWPSLGNETFTLIYSRSGAPLVRFTGSNQVFDGRIDAVLDGGFEAQPSRSVSAPWGTEGPDA
jgi:hypothetical protein